MNVDKRGRMKLRPTTRSLLQAPYFGPGTVGGWISEFRETEIGVAYQCGFESRLRGDMARYIVSQKKNEYIFFELHVLCLWRLCC